MHSPASYCLSKLRLAKIDDVHRVAVMSTAAFFYSPVFAWKRSSHHKYPADTKSSYAKLFAEAIKDPSCIALLNEDEFDLKELHKTGVTMSPDSSWEERRRSCRCWCCHLEVANQFSSAWAFHG